MPEAPQMQALSERVGDWLIGATFEGYDPLGFTGLKTFDPPPEALVGAVVVSVSTAREVRVAALRQRPADHVPPLPSRSARLRAAAQEDAAQGISRAVAVLR